MRVAATQRLLAERQAVARHSLDLDHSTSALTMTVLGLEPC